MSGHSNHGLLHRIRLADIRNRAVFEVYKQCGITVDTYFERYSSPNGSESQNEMYSRIAHGSAQATATETLTLSNMLIWMQILKRFFTVYDYVHTDDQVNKHNELDWCNLDAQYRRKVPW